MLIERSLETIMRLVALTLAVVLILDIPLWIAGLVIAAILLLAIPTFVTWLTRNASTVVPRLLARSAQIPDLNREKLREAMVDFQNNVSTMRAARGITVAVGYSLAMWGLFLLFFVFGFQALGSDCQANSSYVGDRISNPTPLHASYDWCLSGYYRCILASVWLF